MTRRVATILALGLLLAPASRAQFNVVGPGSTVEGDYLRGVGAAATGLGIYNLATAQAEAIHVDTAIRWTEYENFYFARINAAQAAQRQADRERREANFKAILERIRTGPQERDLMSGDALNALLEALNDPKISESSFRSARVTLAADLIRHVPFRIDAEGAEFSMIRMIPRGPGKWPVAFQDDRFATDRRNYERAIDQAIEEQLSGKMSREAIERVKQAVEGLSRALDSARLDPKGLSYRLGRERVLELHAMAKLLESDKVERAMAVIDGYGGTTVNDLRIFMRNHHLRFGSARSPEERGLYKDLYDALLAQRMMMDEGINPDK